MSFRVRAVRVVLRIPLPRRFVTEMARPAARVGGRVPFTRLVLSKVHVVFAARALETARRGRRRGGPGIWRLLPVTLLSILLLRPGGARRWRRGAGLVAGSV